MDDYRNSPTIKFCADLFPAHRCPSVLKPLDDPTRLLLRCSRWSLGHRSSDVKSSTARISSHLSNRALLCLQPASAVVCLRHTLRFANSKQRMNKISPKPCHKKCRSANLRVCKSASLQVCRSVGLQVCSLRLSHTAFSTDNPENFSLQFLFMIRRRKKISDSWILWNVPFRKEQSAHVKSETNLDDFLSSVILNS